MVCFDCAEISGACDLQSASLHDASGGAAASHAEEDALSSQVTGCNRHVTKVTTQTLCWQWNDNNNVISDLSVTQMQEKTDWLVHCHHIYIYIAIVHVFGTLKCGYIKMDLWLTIYLTCTDGNDRCMLLCHVYLPYYINCWVEYAFKCKTVFTKVTPKLLLIDTLLLEEILTALQNILLCTNWC